MTESIPLDGLPPASRRWAVSTVMVAVSMASLDTSIANAVLPTIAADVHATPAASIWVVNAYQLALVACLLPFASLGEIFGFRRVYGYGLAVFTGASAGLRAELVAADADGGAGAAGRGRGGDHEREHGADPLHLPGAPAGPRGGAQRDGGGGRDGAGADASRRACCPWRRGHGCSR